MKGIIRYLVFKEMNFRLFILWVFAAIIMLCTVVSAIAITQAICAVSDYTKANPQVWIGRK